ncbi:MAG TPA: hypothetical protein VFI33_13900, partial [Puia sp.]|nr:hypothetical protein [Puia sp.]
MKRSLIYFLCGCCWLLRANAQSGDKTARDRTILELSTAALYVRSDASISLESALTIYSTHFGLNQMAVIGEGLDETFCEKYGQWMRNGNVDSFSRIIPTLKLTEQLKAKWLIGAWYAFQPDNSSYHKSVEILSQVRDAAIREGDAEMEAQCDCLLSKDYYMLGDTARGRQYYFSVVRNPAFSRAANIQAKANKYIGIYGPFISPMAKIKMAGLTTAYQQYQQLKDTGNQLNIMMDIAYQRFAGGDLKGSWEAALKSLQLQKDWSFPYTQYSYDLMAFLKEFEGDHAG